MDGCGLRAREPDALAVRAESQVVDGVRRSQATGDSGPTLPDNKSGFDHPAPPSMVVKPSYVIGLPDDRANRAAPESMTPPAAAIVIHSTSGGGFSWSDAAIGAIAMLGLAFVLGAGLAAVRGHRRHAAA